MMYAFAVPTSCVKFIFIEALLGESGRRGIARDKLRSRLKTRIVARTRLALLGTYGCEHAYHPKSASSRQSFPHAKNQRIVLGGLADRLSASTIGFVA